MKIGIIGDTHFGAGYSLGKLDHTTQLNARLIDFVNTFNSIVDTFIQKDVEAIVITGDIFETRHPTSAQLNAFSRCIRRAIKETNKAHKHRELKIFIVVGNHDQQRTISTTTVDIFNTLELPDVYVFAKMGSYKLLDDNGKIVNLVFMPYRDRRMTKEKTSEDAVNSLERQLNNVCAKINGTSIVIGHFMVDRAITGQTGEVFSMSELVIPSKIFKGMDAVIMGHVHQHEILRPKSPIIIYAGSMDRVSFGERAHTKVSIVLDTDDINRPEVIKTDVRSLYEMNFDYTSGDKYYKNQITDRILLDIDKFNMKFGLDSSIVKMVARVKENDLYYISQERIKKHILSKNVKHLSPMQISTISLRKLRNKSITENVSGKKAMTSFLNSLAEPANVKRKLLKFANNIIEAVEGK